MAQTQTTTAAGRNWSKYIVTALHIIVMLLSGVLIAWISYDTLRNVSFLSDTRYLRVQFWICLFFIADVLAEWLLAPAKGRFFVKHIFFLLVSIPYLNIISAYGIELSPEMHYLMRFVPMIRAAYILGIVIGVTSANWVSSLFASYITILIALTYFCSLMFFVEEHYVNADIPSYWDALWWTLMDLTTIGSYIEPVTPTGKVLSVILSGAGLILFPVITVYITDRVTRKPDDTAQKSAQTANQPQSTGQASA